MKKREFEIVKVDQQGRRITQRRLVEEYPLKLVVNGRELATLIASPHQLNFLVAGFFRLQGFVSSLDDFRMLGICAERGVAEVRIRGEAPERLRPTLTSGCGTGIVFELPDGQHGLHGRHGSEKPSAMSTKSMPSTRSSYPEIAPSAVFALMRDLARRAEQYASHGGIHSAAVGDGERLLLFAEDLGRHNTLDRIAGEALFRGLDLRGKILASSGRVSTEMVAKAARLGISVVASRTSPTDLAVRAAEAAGITLIGYLRGESFEIYSHPERLAGGTAGAGIALPLGAASSAPTTSRCRISGVTGVILAGGESRRMGCDKSLLPIDGGRFIEHIYRKMAALFEEVIVVTNSPGLYSELPCRKVPDLYPLKGSLTGIHSGLRHAGHEKIFVAACDMPFLHSEVIRRICERGGRGDVVIPQSKHGKEPLHALYDKSCIPAIEAALDAGEKRIVSFFPRVRVHEVPGGTFRDCDPEGRTFRNINTPQEYFALRDRGKEEQASGCDLPLAGRRRAIDQI